MEYSEHVDEQATYLFRCGIADAGNSGKFENRNVPFVLDYDYSQSDIEIDKALALLDKFHEVHFSFFWWSLGEKAREGLTYA